MRYSFFFLLSYFFEIHLFYFCYFHTHALHVIQRNKREKSKVSDTVYTKQKGNFGETKVFILAMYARTHIRTYAHTYVWLVTLRNVNLRSRLECQFVPTHMNRASLKRSLVLQATESWAGPGNE